MNSQELKATLSIALLYVVRMLGLFMVLPVLPLMADSIEASTPFLIGLALGAYGLSQAILQIPMGIWSDRYGRKRIIAIGLLIFIIGSLVAGFSTDIYGIIFGRFLQGCGAIASTLLALVGDVTRTENRTKAMAIVGMSIGASFAIALVLGPWINAQVGVDGMFFATAAFGALGLLVLATFPVAPTSQRNPETFLYMHKLKTVLMDRGIMRTTFGVFVLHYLLMSSFVVFPLLMHGTGEVALTSHHLYYFSLLLVTFILMAPLMRLSDRQGFALPLALVMIGTFIAANVVLASSGTFILVMLGMGLFFMAFNLLEVVLPAMMSRIAPAGFRGTAMGVYSSAQFAGAFVGGALGGFIAGGWEITYVLWVNALICLIWIGVTMGLASNDQIRDKVETLIYSYAGNSPQSSQEVLKAVLSVRGVLGAELVEAEEVAYLKVDRNILDTGALDNMRRTTA
jgi:MFS family permease